MGFKRINVQYKKSLIPIPETLSQFTAPLSQASLVLPKSVSDTLSLVTNRLQW